MLLTFFGLFIGIRQSLRSPAGRWSGYRGLWYWHHVPGLIFGLFALTWVVSGLVSMNPWGFLDSDGAAPAVDEMIGPPFSAAQVRQTLRSLAAASLPADVVSLQATRLWGQLRLIEAHADGTRTRVDADGHPTRSRSTIRTGRESARR